MWAVIKVAGDCFGKNSPESALERIEDLLLQNMQTVISMVKCVYMFHVGLIDANKF